MLSSSRLRPNRTRGLVRHAIAITARSVPTSFIKKFNRPGEETARFAARHPIWKRGLSLSHRAGVIASRVMTGCWVIDGPRFPFNHILEKTVMRQ